MELAPGHFANALKPVPATPALPAPRQRPYHSGASVQIGELRLLAAASRPDVCARLAQLAARVNPLPGSDIYGIRDLAKTARKWQEATILKCDSKSHSNLSARGEVDGEMRTRDGKTPAGRADAACGDQTSEGRCRLCFAIGLVPSMLEGPCHILRLTSVFSRKLVRSSLGGEVLAFSGMGDHMALFFAPILDLSLGVVGLEGCEGLSTHLRNKKTFAGKVPEPHFLGLQRSLGDGELDNVSPEEFSGNPADGSTEVTSDMGPLERFPQSVFFCSGTLRPFC